MSDKKNFFGHEHKVNKIVFKPLVLNPDAQVKQISDPPPRPLPSSLEEQRESSQWTPKSKNANKGKEVLDNIQKVGHISKYLFFVSFALASMAGVGFAIYWVMNQYNIGG